MPLGGEKRTEKSVRASGCLDVSDTTAAVRALERMAGLKSPDRNRKCGLVG